MSRFVFSMIASCYVRTGASLFINIVILPYCSYCSYFYFKAVKASWDMLLKEGRPNAKKVLVVISDKRSSSLDSEIRNEIKPLQDNDVVIIPVALGNEADERQLKLLIDAESSLVLVKTTDDTTDIKDKLMVVVFKGLLKFILYSSLFTLHAARCTLHAARCTLHAARCTLHAARCTLHAARCTLHAARCTLHAARCTLHAARCTLHAARCTLYAVRCTLHAAPCTLHPAPCSLHSVLFALHSSKETFKIFADDFRAALIGRRIYPSIALTLQFSTFAIYICHLCVVHVVRSLTGPFFRSRR